MRIGVISDTHGSLPALAVHKLEGCDHIIHAGDICSLSVLLKLEQIAPVTAVYGNCDFSDFGPDVRDVAEVTLGGVRFYVTHRPEDVPSINPAVMDVVVHGHTHVPVVCHKHGVLVFNPGSCTRPRGGNTPTVGMIETAAGHVTQAKIVPLLV